MTLANAEAYGEVEATWTKRGERHVLDTFLSAGNSVLEIGCGTGRITRELARRRVRVVACDVNPLAVAKLRASLGAASDVTVTVGDARCLPFADEAFDAVVFAFNGLDFIHPEADRFRAVREIARVLRPGGVFIFSSHNPLGTLLSPRGLKSPAEVARRARYLVSGNVFRAYFRYRGRLAAVSGIASACNRRHRRSGAAAVRSRNELCRVNDATVASDAVFELAVLRLSQDLACSLSLGGSPFSAARSCGGLIQQPRSFRSCGPSPSRLCGNAIR